MLCCAVLQLRLQATVWVTGRWTRSLALRSAGGGLLVSLFHKDYYRYYTAALITARPHPLTHCTSALIRYFSASSPQQHHHPPGHHHSGPTIPASDPDPQDRHPASTSLPPQPTIFLTANNLLRSAASPACASRLTLLRPFASPSQSALSLSARANLHTQPVHHATARPFAVRVCGATSRRTESLLLRKNHIDPGVAKRNSSRRFAHLVQLVQKPSRVAVLRFATLRPASCAMSWKPLPDSAGAELAEPTFTTSTLPAEPTSESFPLFSHSKRRHFSCPRRPSSLIPTRVELASHSPPSTTVPLVTHVSHLNQTLSSPASRSQYHSKKTNTPKARHARWVGAIIASFLHLLHLLCLGYPILELHA